MASRVVAAIAIKVRGLSTGSSRDLVPGARAVARRPGNELLSQLF